ncbi:MAG: glycosyltransferase family 1 protein, partial [Pseudomonadota bacterium]
RSAFLSDATDRPNPAVEALFDLDGVARASAASAVRAELAFLHHPLVFFHGVEERVAVQADRAAMVVHQTPFRGDGSLEYDPLMTQRRVRKAFGLKPLWAPISGLCRRQLETFAPLLRLTSEDWINVFDPGEWRPTRPIFDGPAVTIGRHGRADPLKWPETAEAVEASLPEGPRRRIRVMGAPEAHLASLGVDMSGWEVVPFGGEPVADFLDTLDVFAFHHHPRWVETFGRTVAEAALKARLAIVEPTLAPTFGDLAIPVPAAEVDAAIRRFEEAPAAARARGEDARRIALARYSVASVEGRWRRLLMDEGVALRGGADRGGRTPPLTALRKLAGLYRRRAAARG